MPLPESADLDVRRGWLPGPAADRVLTALRSTFDYGPGEDRATGGLYGDGQDWSSPLAAVGPVLLAVLERDLGILFPLVAFQGYRGGAGCGWHADDPFDAQAILSLGVTRSFGVRPTGGTSEVWYQVAHGDLTVMPAGFQLDWQHCVPVEDVTGERCSMVFRTIRR